MTNINPLPVSLLHRSDVDPDETLFSLNPETEALRHLILLIPADWDCITVTPRICRLADETNSSVRLLGLYRDAAEEPALRRDLATMSALIRDAHVCVDITIERGTNWVEVIRHDYQEGDIIVCIAGQSTGIGRRPLSQVLESSFKAPVYILSDPPLPGQPGSSWLSGFMSWAGVIAIIAGAFLLQVQIVSITAGWAQITLLILSIFAEIGLIGLWNSLFG